MTQRLGISSSAVKTRLIRKGIKPFQYIGSAGIYREADMEAIRDGGTRGRPKVETKGKANTKAKSKKPAKKS